MTKEIKGLEEHLNDLKDAYANRGDKPYGMLFGDRVFSWNVQKVETELKYAKRIRKNL